MSIDQRDGAWLAPGIGKGFAADVIAHHVGHESIQMISRVYSHIKTDTSHDLIIRALARD